MLIKLQLVEQKIIKHIQEKNLWINVYNYYFEKVLKLNIQKEMLYKDDLKIGYLKVILYNSLTSAQAFQKI